MSVLNLPLVRRTRRNHGLEHATIHVLSSRFHGLSMAGRSTPNGFYIFGNVSTEEVRSAVDEGLQRMRNGEPHLAVHPGCGTNYLTSGVFAGLATFATVAFSKRNRWEQLPNAI